MPAKPLTSVGLPDGSRKYGVLLAGWPAKHNVGGKTNAILALAPRSNGWPRCWEIWWPKKLKSIWLDKNRMDTNERDDFIRIRKVGVEMMVVTH